MINDDWVTSFILYDHTLIKHVQIVELECVGLHILPFAEIPISFYKIEEHIFTNCGFEIHLSVQNY